MSIIGEFNPAAFLDMDTMTWKPFRTPYYMVKEFHIAFNLPVSERPQLDSLSEEDSNELRGVADELEHYVEWMKTNHTSSRMLRARLMLEEVAEYLHAEADNDIVGIADGLADIQYIGNGTAVAYGIPLDNIFKDVHDNNMTKLGPDGKPIVDETGKVRKPANYVPVDLSKYFKEE